MNGSAASILVDVLMDGVHNPLGSEEFRTSGFCFSVLGYRVSTCAVVYISRYLVSVSWSVMFVSGGWRKSVAVVIALLLFRSQESLICCGSGLASRLSG